MKIINKHTYADIIEKNIETQYIFKSDPHYQTITAYKVVFTTEYDIVIFGKAFHKVKTKETPFLFGTLNMAKDFCEVNPNYKNYTFLKYNSVADDSVQYKTYKITIEDEELGYIWWNRESVIFSDKNCRVSFDYDKQPIVFGFVKNIILNDWEDTYGLSSVKYQGFESLISKMIPKEVEEPEERKWRFELIDQVQ